MGENTKKTQDREPRRFLRHPPSLQVTISFKRPHWYDIGIPFTGRAAALVPGAIDMKRDNHYEVAFEAFLRERGAATLPIVEARRSYLDDSEIKSPDFLVVGPAEVRFVVDVKGRTFPGRGPRCHKVWESWSPRADVEGLARWAARFGPGFRGVLAFVYHVLPDVDLMWGTPDVFRFRDRRYLMRGVSVLDYRAAMRPRSPRWGTVHLSTREFRRVVKPFSYFLRPPGDQRTDERTEDRGQKTEDRGDRGQKTEDRRLILVL